MRQRDGLISPRSTAARTPQPRLVRWLQLWKRQWPSSAAQVGHQAGQRIASIWRRPNSWKPGESISAPLRASSSQYQVVVVVVCLPAGQRPPRSRPPARGLRAPAG
jgi:hypothetical protein